jgi:hypothetical protein
VRALEAAVTRSVALQQFTAERLAAVRAGELVGAEVGVVGHALECT